MKIGVTGKQREMLVEALEHFLEYLDESDQQKKYEDCEELIKIVEEA